MNLLELEDKIRDFWDLPNVLRLDDKVVTVQTGNHKWEEVVALVYCQECDQFHIISEAIEKDDTDKKEV